MSLVAVGVWWPGAASSLALAGGLLLVAAMVDGVVGAVRAHRVGPGNAAVPA
jgi:hypothetical protein